MLTEPQVVERSEQPYVGIKASVSMGELDGLIPALLPELFGWLEAHGIEPAAPPFMRYNLIDMERQLQVEVGVPVASSVAGEGRIHADVLPAGRYATLRHIGHYDGLVDANEALQVWAADKGLAFDMAETPEGDRFGSRLEVYETDPAEEPDPTKWVTEVAYRLAH